MSLELLAVLLSGGSLIFASIAWLSSRKSVKVAERSLGISEKQLRFASEQAKMRPDLEVTKVRLLDPEEAEGIRGLLREVEEQRTLEKEWEEKSKQIEQLPMAERLFEEDRLAEEYVDLSVKKNGYGGPLPDKVVRVDLTNWGETAVFGVTGWVYLESSHLEPLDYFISDAKIFENQGGAYRVKVGDGRNVLLAPGGEYSFDIAVSVRTPGTTWVVCDFFYPMGPSTQSMKALEIPDR
jgi:hypothetical protein